ncbi:MAG: 5-formyltetrahydrofolate cyclo-ligase [Rhodomicrobium sp.]
MVAARKAALRAEAAERRERVWQRSGQPPCDALGHLGAELISKFPNAATISGYRPIRSELDPLPLLEALHAQGKQIALPIAQPGPSLKFRAWTPGLPLVRNRLGIEEPSEEQSEVRPDVVLVPLLAFDRSGDRLGYGAGYYDAAIRFLRETGPVTAIGISFDEQEFPEIPREPQDEPLDMILTPTRVIACGESHAAPISR